MLNIPYRLRHALETGECVLFLGAGVGFNLKNAQGGHAPTARQLSEELANHFGIEAPDVSDLARVSTIVELRKGRTELDNYIRMRLDSLEPDNDLLWLFSLRWRAIFTTNFDSSIQRAYQRIAEPLQTPVIFTATSEVVNYDLRFQVPVYYLHGNLFTSTRPHIIVTNDDYAMFRERRRMLFELLKKESATSTILYIGYSNQDPNWKLIYSEMQEDFYPSSLPIAYRIAPETDPLEREILKSKNIDTLDSTLSVFVHAAKQVLSKVDLDVDRIRELRSTIPPDLVNAFDKSPAAVSRLLSSWQYVNQALFHEIPNVSSFLRGDRANWALIADDIPFERDIQEELYEDLLDYATSGATTPTVKVLLASAGYGVTTLSMVLAFSLVREKAGAVFMLKPGQSVVEGDIEFACSLFNHSPFFFVDNAADFIPTINSAVSRLRDSERSALFFLGERLNEWRQAHNHPRCKEYELEALSDSEITRLLSYLEQHSALNALKPLTADLRFEAIRQKHGKDLLVVMRESTEGKSFDAILEDEFHGISDATSRQAYLITCCFYQHGAYVRDKLLAELIGLPLADLYDSIGSSTDGVVMFDPLDEATGLYGARARHRVIAAVVWERCGTLADRETILQSALDKLNLNHTSDKEAFELFVRSDRLIDEIQSLEGKIRFFDKACQKEPLSPYVRQHYARMFLRSQIPDLALQQIDRAIELNPKLRVLYHTRGHILAEMASTTPSVDVARRRLTQSEDSFMRALGMQSGDEYSYQGLARLYFRWAKRLTDLAEQSHYITKAEEWISEGLRNSRVRDSLWILSAEIQDWLDDQASRIKALENAVRESPGSVIARYVLARAYRRQSNPDKAIEVLEPALRQDLNEFRVTVEYALAMLLLGKTYSEAIAVLNLSTLYGFSDPRFIATLGGMHFLNNDFTKAEEVFQKATMRNFSSRELKTVHFRPSNPQALDECMQLVGMVAVVRPGYALINTTQYPRILCPGTKFGGLIMVEGLHIKFCLAFTAKGAIAEAPEELHRE